MLGVQDGAVAFGLKGRKFSVEAGGFGFGVLYDGRQILAALGLKELLERLLDAQQAQVGPH